MWKILTIVKLKQICCLIGGVILCIYILVPLFSAFLLGLALSVPKDSFTVLLFADSMLVALAFGISGFLMALIISYGWVNREIEATVLGSLIAAVFYVAQSRFTFGTSQLYEAYRLLEASVHAICLVGFAIIGAWLIAKRRHLKLKKGT